MQFVQDNVTVTYEIKKSKFIATLVPYWQFDETMKRLKKEHPKARHFVYAYRYLNSLEQIVENSSDDGEPKGTSGKPALTVLYGNELINSAVIIVRYFGGIKLGTGGLVKAYTEATNLTIKGAKLQEYIKLYTAKISFEYSHVSKVEYHAIHLNIEIKEKTFEQNVIFVLSGSLKMLEKLLNFLKQENIIDQNDIIN
jgi:uncharacterized YigZ family protein